MTSKALRSFLLVAFVSPALFSCGGGIPVRVHIDEFKFDLSLDEVVGGVFDQFQAQGLFPPETAALPELWPSSLPRIQFRALVTTPPMPIDLTPPETDPDFDKYQSINNAAEAIRRIEINRLIMRVEESSLTIGLPELRLQVADNPEADPADRLAWQTIGFLPARPVGFKGDNEFNFMPSGEIYLNEQLMDDTKEFAIRAVGKLDLDTGVNPRMPAGAAALRMIIVATFFVDPEGAINAASSFDGAGF